MQVNEARGDRSRLTFDQLKTLEDRVLPTARRRAKIYDPQSGMYRHAMQTLAYWSEA